MLADPIPERLHEIDKGAAGSIQMPEQVTNPDTRDRYMVSSLIYYLGVIRQAVDRLHEYIRIKTDEVRLLEGRLRGMGRLNHRQRALISHALRHKNHVYTIESHRMSHSVVYQTARTDLQTLANQGLLTVRKVGRTWYFTPVPDVEARLRKPDGRK